MSARDIIALEMREPEWPKAIARADATLKALQAAGYRILAPGQLDPATIEAAAKVANDHGSVCRAQGDVWGAGNAALVASAIRALQGER